MGFSPVEPRTSSRPAVHRCTVDQHSEAGGECARCTREEGGWCIVQVPPSLPYPGGLFPEWLFRLSSPPGGLFPLVDSRLIRRVLGGVLSSFD